MFQFFRPVHGVTVLIMGSEEFKQLVIFSGDDSDLSSTLAVIFQLAGHNLDPFVGSQVVIF